MPVFPDIHEVHTSSTSPDYTKCLTGKTAGTSTCCRENKPSAIPIHKCQLAWTQHIHACEQAMTHRMQQTSKVMDLERRQQALHAYT